MDPLREPFNAAAFFVDRHVADGRGGRTAFRVGGRALTYAEVADRVGRAAGALREAGLDAEQRALLVPDDSALFPDRLCLLDRVPHGMNEPFARGEPGSDALGQPVVIHLGQRPPHVAPRRTLTAPRRLPHEDSIRV